MKKPLQLGLFFDDMRRSPPLDWPRLQAKLDEARQRLRNLIILGLRPGLSEEMRASVRKVESWTPSELKVHRRMLEHVRARRRSPG